jgi:nucleotide-binding universal stress UspA family protein
MTELAEARMFQNIVVGLDGSAGATRALESAIELAALTKGALHAVSVEEHLPAYAATVGEVDDEDRFEHHYFRRVQADARRLASGANVTVSFEILRGHAADQLVRVAVARHADLLVIGHAGHSRLHNFLLGSTADRVVEHALCPVLVVR